MKQHNTTLYLRQDLQDAWQGQNPFDMARRMQGTIYRDKEGRRTLSFTLGGYTYFLKHHRGIGWPEIIKNLLQGRLPIVSARNEWLAVERLERLGVDTLSLAGYGERGVDPARRESFIITDALTDTMSLEQLGSQWRQRPPSLASRRCLLRKLALISRTLHEGGINHRDYYLCHFLLDARFASDNRIDESTRLFLIDLHRAQIRRHVPDRWRIKDLAGLYFSAFDVPMSRRDRLRFIRLYSNKPLKRALKENGGFWRRVEERARKTLARDQRRQPG